MYSDEKEMLIINGIIDLVVVIFCVFLHSFCQGLLKIREQYKDDIFLEITNIIKADGYLFYLIGGLVCAAALIFFCVWWFKRIRGIEMFFTVCIALLVNIMIFVILIGVFWDPVFTTFLLFLGMGYAALNAA